MAIDPQTATAADVQSSQLTPAELSALAQHRRDLWPEIQNHPQCDPGLGQWIQQQMQQNQPPAPQGSQPGQFGQQNQFDQQPQPSAPSQPGQFGQPVPPPATQGSQPGQFSQQPQSDQQPQPSAPSQPGQFGQPVQQNAPGQPGYPNQPGAAAGNQYGAPYGNQQYGGQAPGAAPNSFQPGQAGAAAANAAADFKAALIDARSRGWRAWGPFGIILFGVLIFISAFLPLVHASAAGFGFRVSASCSYFYCGGYGEAGMVFLGILTILAGVVPAVFAVLSIVNKGTTPFRLVAAITAAVSALYGIIMGIIFLASLPGGGGYGVSAGPGFGTILLLISGLGIGSFAVITFLSAMGGPKPGMGHPGMAGPGQAPGTPMQQPYGSAPQPGSHQKISAPPANPSSNPQGTQPPAASQPGVQSQPLRKPSSGHEGTAV